MENQRKFEERNRRGGLELERFIWVPHGILWLIMNLSFLLVLLTQLHVENENEWKRGMRQQQQNANLRLKPPGNFLAEKILLFPSFQISLLKPVKPSFYLIELTKSLPEK